MKEALACMSMRIGMQINRHIWSYMYIYIYFYFYINLCQKYMYVCVCDLRCFEDGCIKSVDICIEYGSYWRPCGKLLAMLNHHQAYLDIPTAMVDNPKRWASWIAKPMEQLFPKNCIFGRAGAVWDTVDALMYILHCIFYCIYNHFGYINPVINSSTNIQYSLSWYRISDPSVKSNRSFCRWGTGGISKSVQDLGGNTLAAAIAGCCQPASWRVKKRGRQLGCRDSCCTTAEAKQAKVWSLFLLGMKICWEILPRN